MFDFETPRKGLDDWRTHIYRKFRKELEVAQAEIKRDIGIEIYRQARSRNDGKWQSLSPTYAKRKKREYADGKFAFNSMLRRTGEMLKGYASSILPTLTKTQVGIEIQYPDNAQLGSTNSRVGARAIAHEGGYGNMPERSFNKEKFKEIAMKHFNEAMSRAAGNV